MKQTSTHGLIGRGYARVDGHLKVTGRAVYGADQPSPGAAHAVLVTAPIALGEITGIDETEARKVVGLCDILTYQNVGEEVKSGRGAPDKQHSGYVAGAWPPLGSPEIHYAGQIIAVVVADTPEIADQAAERLKFTFREEMASGSFDDPGSEEIEPFAPLGEPELCAGDFDKAFAHAPVCLDAWYETPPQHHNPMELFQATCVWSNDGQQLDVYESSQNVRGHQHGLALQLGISPENIRVHSPYTGGGFGSRGRMGQATALIALAAKRLGRMVKFVATRTQMFTIRHYRAETRHHLRLGVTTEGRLIALEHNSWELTGRDDTFATAGSDATARLYACDNVRTCVKNVRADRQAPGFMRAPPEMPYLFAMESAMDELAYKLKMDPLELRRRNETRVETVTHKPYTSRSLLQCMEKGAKLFGWPQRNPEIGSHSTPTEHVGWGYATAFYPTQIQCADCAITLTEQLQVRVETSTAEIGNGVRTVIAQTTADLLGLPLASVEVAVGDSTLAPAPIAAGSSSTASICSVLALACENIRSRLARAASAAVVKEKSILAGVPVDEIRLQEGLLIAGSLVEPLSVSIRRAGGGEEIYQRATNTPEGMSAEGHTRFLEGKPSLVGGAGLKDRMQFAFGAQFAEVRIHRATQMLRVARLIGVFAAGRIMNRRTAWAQLNAGQIWGISSATHEATELDPRYARYINQDLSEYLLPVAADVGEVETILLDEVDTLVNPLGIKGVGELGVTGVNAAVTNAIFHATGDRQRRLPIRLGELRFPVLHGSR